MERAMEFHWVQWGSKKYYMELHDIYGVHEIFKEYSTTISVEISMVSVEFRRHFVLRGISSCLMIRLVLNQEIKSRFVVENNRV